MAWSLRKRAKMSMIGWDAGETTRREGFGGDRQSKSVPNKERGSRVGKTETRVVWPPRCLASWDDADRKTVKDRSDPVSR
jgi:hypothetical protein